MNTPDLRAALAAQGDTLADFFSRLPLDVFFDGTDDRWSPAHHVSHLTRSVRPVARALAVPDRLPLLDPARPGRAYEAVRAEYRAALAAGGRAFGRFLPETPEGRDDSARRALLADLGAAQNELLAGLDALPEPDLDRLALPHPLLGPMSLREMLLFTHYHGEHHLAGVRSRLPTP